MTLLEPLLHELPQPGKTWFLGGAVVLNRRSLFTSPFAVTNTLRIDHGLYSGRHIRPGRHTGLSFDIFATNALGKTALFTLVEANAT